MNKQINENIILIITKEILLFYCLKGLAVSKQLRRTMLQLNYSLVTFIFLYARESWTLTAELQRRMKAMEMSYYRKILRISYKDYVTTRKSVPRRSRQSDHTKTS